MVIGLCTIQLELPTAQTLKDKRQVIQSLMRRARNQYNISISEVEQQDRPNAATLAIACVSTEPAYAHGLLSRVVQSIEQSRLDAILLNFEIELL
jgi:hypothetical protein